MPSYFVRIGANVHTSNFSVANFSGKRSSFLQEFPPSNLVRSRRWLSFPFDPVEFQLSPERPRFAFTGCRGLLRLSWSSLLWLRGRRLGHRGRSWTSDSIDPRECVPAVGAGFDDTWLPGSRSLLPTEPYSRPTYFLSHACTRICSCASLFALTSLPKLTFLDFEIPLKLRG